MNTMTAEGKDKGILPSPPFDKTQFRRYCDATQCGGISLI